MLDFAHKLSQEYKNKKDKDGNYVIPVLSLNERPGQQRMTYSAVCDYFNKENFVRQIYERAMEQSDANVNKSVDFVRDKCPLIELYAGHKPFSVMVDSRGKKEFQKIVANKDRSTLTFEIFKTHPVLER